MINPRYTNCLHKDINVIILTTSCIIYAVVHLIGQLFENWQKKQVLIDATLTVFLAKLLSCAQLT